MVCKYHKYVRKVHNTCMFVVWVELKEKRHLETLNVCWFGRWHKKDGLLGFIICLMFNQDSWGYSQLNLMEVCGLLDKTCALFMTKICDFPYTLFMTRSKIRYTIYDCCSWHSCPKHNFWRACVYDLIIDNNEIVASSKNISNSRLEYQKENTLTKVANSIPYLWPKHLKNHTLWSCTEPI